MILYIILLVLLSLPWTQKELRESGEKVADKVIELFKK